jgi:hypothetical protein
VLLRVHPHHERWNIDHLPPNPEGPREISMKKIQNPTVACQNTRQIRSK